MPFLTALQWKSALLCNFQMLPSVSKITTDKSLVYYKQQSYDVWFLRYGAWQTEFSIILDHYPLNNLKNQNFEKMKRKKKKKNTWRYYHFTQVHHKWQSYDAWFLRYQVWQTEFFMLPSVSKITLDKHLVYYK